MRPPTRSRLLLLTSLLAAFGLLAAACGDDDGGGDSAAPGDAGVSCEVGQTDGDLSLYNWSEYIDPELISAFEEQYGVTVTEDFFPSNEELFARVADNNPGFDVAVPSDYMVSILADEGLLLPLDHDAIPNLANLAPEFASGLPFDPDLTWSVAYQWGTTGLAVDMEVVGEDFPESWALVFDPAYADQYAGKISLLDDPRETLGAALKYLGYSLNTTDEGQLAEARDVIRSVIDDVAAFDSDQFEDLLVGGEVAIAHGWSGDFFGAFDDASTDDFDAYERYYYFVPEEGGVRWVDNMVILRDAPHPCTAHTFINFLLEPENAAALTNFNFYASPVAAAEPFIDPEILDDPSIYPPPETLANLEFIADTGDFEINYTDAFTAAKS